MAGGDLGIIHDADDEGAPSAFKGVEEHLEGQFDRQVALHLMCLSMGEQQKPLGTLNESQEVTISLVSPTPFYLSCTPSTVAGAAPRFWL